MKRGKLTVVSVIIDHFHYLNISGSASLYKKLTYERAFRHTVYTVWKRHSSLKTNYFCLLAYFGSNWIFRGIHLYNKAGIECILTYWQTRIGPALNWVCQGKTSILSAPILWAAVNAFLSILVGWKGREISFAFWSMQSDWNKRGIYRSARKHEFYQCTSVFNRASPRLSCLVVIQENKLQIGTWIWSSTIPQSILCSKHAQPIILLTSFPFAASFYITSRSFSHCFIKSRAFQFSPSQLVTKPREFQPRLSEKGSQLTLTLQSSRQLSKWAASFLSHVQHLIFYSKQYQ